MRIGVRPNPKKDKDARRKRPKQSLAKYREAWVDQPVLDEKGKAVLRHGKIKMRRVKVLESTK